MAENFLNLKEDMDIQMKLKGPQTRLLWNMLYKLSEVKGQKRLLKVVWQKTTHHKLTTKQPHKVISGFFGIGWYIFLVKEKFANQEYSVWQNCPSEKGLKYSVISKFWTSNALRDDGG